MKNTAIQSFLWLPELDGLVVEGGGDEVAMRVVHDVQHLRAGPVGHLQQNKVSISQRRERPKARSLAMARHVGEKKNKCSILRDTHLQYIFELA